MSSFTRQQTTPILRTSSDYAPAPSSGSNLSELASLIGRQSSKISAMNSDKSVGYNVSRNAASVLSPRANPSIMRSISIDSDTILPITQNNKRNDNSDQAPQKPRRSTLRAAESGKGTLLPMRGAPTSLFRQQQQQRINRQAPARSNSSGPSYSTGLPRTRQDVGDSNVHLRRRTANASSDDEFDSSSQRVSNQNDAYRRSNGNRRQRQNSAISVSSTGSVGGTSNGNNISNREHASSTSWGNGVLCQDQLNRLSRMKLGHLLQVVIVLAVMALVYESHHKALLATQHLLQFKEEESLLLLHLQKIEQQSIQLHENFNRLAKMGGEGNANPDDRTGENEVDINLIKQQTEQLYRMEQELSHEVDTLQKRIQRSARNHIIQEFGEGPVQVVLELDFGDAESNAGSRRISILLWRETPHAAWTWLEQIGNNIWDGAEFKWQQGHIIDAVPHKDSGDGKIEFVERSQHEHIAWSVGVREQPNNGSGGGSMSMYINLQDNSQLHKHETCVGKVIDGFDTLQKLLELSRNNGNGNQKDNSSLPILIRKATAEHYVTKKGGMGK